ncbi:hypothetical protein [Streptomyces alkaliphilus]|uniref:hypothetical protein n=1 Tax=Streptomyces alkaliphilus TaxID=1472722 RepID=UPI001E6468D4|nr:hypothetical protein [Streptomyces alkaliphilus]
MLPALAEGLRLPGAAGSGITADVPDRFAPSSADPPVPPADHARPDGPVDTSVAAVTAFARLELGRQERAAAIVAELTRSHLTADGRLLDGCYDAGSGTATAHELIWGTFFLASALAVLTGLVDLRETGFRDTPSEPS